MRKNVYFSRRLDMDIIEYMEEHKFHLDFSHNVKNLMRDGIKFRSTETLSTRGGVKNRQVDTLQQHSIHPQTTCNFSDIDIKKKDVDLQDLEDRLNMI